MREETPSGSEGWHRLGQLMIQLGQFNRAEELYEILLKQTSNEGEKGHFFINLDRSRMMKENMQKLLNFMQNQLKSSRRFSLQIIPI